MKLTKARVENFKCVEDSEEFSIGEVTCLVGKNESGKTALLEALYKLNPVEDDAASFDRIEYPRRFVTNVGGGGEDGTATADVVTTSWALDAEDVRVVTEALGTAAAFAQQEVVIKKGYANSAEYVFDVDEAQVCSAVVGEATLNAAELATLRSAATVEQILAAISDAENPTAKHAALDVRLRELFPTTVRDKAEAALSTRMPKFLYYDQFYRLPGRIALPALRRREEEKRLEPGDKVFMALLDLVNTTSDEIDQTGDSEELTASLEAIQNTLTDEIFEFWSQNRHLEVRFDFRRGRPEDPPPFNEGWNFTTRIHNSRHRASVGFDRRSAGFVWFFSFLIWFSRVRQNFGDNVVLLLDEPGLSLHGKAQQDLLRYFDERLRPRHQLVYTTHSPFMINARRIEELRTVQDKDGAEEVLGTKVGERILSSDEDTLFPLQGVLGYDIAQSMFVGPHVLVVEGPTESALINWASRQLLSRGRPGLDVRWAVCPAEGASKVTSFVTLFRGRGLSIAALLDYHDTQQGLVDRLDQSDLLEPQHLLRVTDFLEQEEGDIEDILGRTLYAELVAGALDLEPANALPAERPSDAPIRVVKEVEAHCALLPVRYPEFNHFCARDPVNGARSRPDRRLAGRGRCAGAVPACLRPSQCASLRDRSRHNHLRHLERQHRPHQRHGHQERGPSARDCFT